MANKTLYNKAPDQRLLKSVKMEIPSFNGSDPNNWIFRAELYFSMQQIPPHLKVQLAGLKMDGQAAPWFQWMFNTGTIHQLDEFSKTVRQRFDVSAFVDLRGSLSKLSQSGSLCDYVKEFEILLNQVPGFTDDVLMSFFISGLQTDLRGAIQLQWPKSLHHAMQLAYALNTHHEQLRSSISITPKKSTFPNNPNSTTHNLPYHKTSTTSTFTQPVTSTIPRAIPSSSSNLPIKRFPPEEIAKKRELGLCYTCDEKWTARHRCKSQILLLFGEIEEETPELEEEIVWTPNIPGESIEASLHALSGSLNPRALILEAKLAAHLVTVLVDSGRSHNFISRELATTLSIPSIQTRGMKVFMGNGDFLLCEWKCPGVPVVLHNTSFLVDLWILDLHGLNIVLGMTWLSSLGRVTHDYLEQSMEFVWQNQMVKLQGVVDYSHSSVLKSTPLASCCTLMSLTGSDTGIQVLPELQALQSTLDLTVWQVLVHYLSVFQTPHTLPPFRGMDPSIHLVEGAKPVNVRPYRFPHHQKSELEKQITELLSTGMIQPSRSSFSSPVLLVQKQDGSWRMCIDYRALNAITIPDRFPIPTIDELLDELLGVTIFSKLDLRAGYHQIRMLPQDIHKTAFRTHEGHYDFLVMPFG
ncbi:uncharacterized protein LOC133293140 [Gastrolobium bilobum]|uniref:uncharacterized protein LOC133293140 n=1 Tax=Gastrolobium bilobum TaxID=150636 RepID=UPI002AAFB6C3|nr:uncharacterized protein LOC133293140 [Gastrolobium bilobum]